MLKSGERDRLRWKKKEKEKKEDVIDVEEREMWNESERL
jgi:hypothetical protein